MSSSGLAHCFGQVIRGFKTAWWYVCELLGANAYQHYLDRFTLDHHNGEDGHQPMSEKEFWRRRIDEAPVEGGCC
ncbi:MAG: YbdD/YjiX family protein [Propionibacteriaceae bacterium]|jgi:hypothetical protein|nr:YbdD/YjiX family protein [Propionibacteriaceae bacterium]